jgi:3-oxoacyl-[acyl-carrier-protein] synthase-3
MFILGAGHFHPDTVIDNQFLESLDIGTTNEWILERVGIHTRRTCLPLDYIRSTRNQDVRAAHDLAKTAVTDLGVKAAQMALQRANLSASDIVLCIAGVSVPQMNIPSHACLIAKELGISAPSFDLNSACSSFLAQLHFLYNLKIEGPILIIQSETYTLATNYNERETAVLWGDGASACVLSHTHSGKAQIVETTFASNPLEYEKVLIPYGGHFTQQGSRVQRFAISQTEATFHSLKKKGEHINFIGHQANLRMLESVAKRIGVSEERHFFNVHRYGNCGSAGAASVVSERWDLFKPADELSIIAVGAGLSWGGAVVRFL